MEVRKAELRDIEALVNNRLEFISLIRNIEDEEKFRKATKGYIEKHLNESLQAFIALDNNKIVSACILCIYETLPLPSYLTRKTGLLLNVYTIKEYRHRGLAYMLLTKLIEEAKRLDVGKIQLDYTDDGYPLYEKIGFEKLNREMVLKL